MYDFKIAGVIVAFSNVVLKSSNATKRCERKMTCLWIVPQLNVWNHLAILVMQNGDLNDELVYCIHKVMI